MWPVRHSDKLPQRVSRGAHFHAEAHISTQPPSPFQDPRLSCPHENQERGRGIVPPSRQGSPSRLGERGLPRLIAAPLLRRRELVVNSNPSPRKFRIFLHQRQPACECARFSAMSARCRLRHNRKMRGVSPKLVVDQSTPVTTDRRLRRHADYQRVYREGRKQFSPSMSYFYAVRGTDSRVPAGPRVGLTAGKVLGIAVERNRIKRRMRDVVRRRVSIVAANVDIVLHPRKSVLTIEFAKLEGEVGRIFTN